MKKLIPLLVAVLVILLATPAFAAQVKVTGSLSSETGYDPTVDYQSQGLFHDSSLGLGVEAQLSDNLKAVVGLTAAVPGLTDELVNGLRWSDFAMFVDKAYIESTGALFPGMPSMIARLGTQEIGYSDLNAQLDAEGIGFSGLGLGPVSLAGFQAWDHDRQIRGAQVGINPMAGLSVNANVIHAGAGDSQELSTAIEGSVKPFEPLTINAGFGIIPETKAMAIRGGVDYKVLPSVTLHAGARKIDTAFTPLYPLLEEDENGQLVQAITPDTFGVNGGITVSALGATIDTNVDRAMALSTQAVTYTGDLTVERPFAVAGMTFAPKYELSLSMPEAQVGEVSIESQVVSLGYTAPNHITINGGVDITRIQEPKPFVSAGMELTF